MRNIRCSTSFRTHSSIYPYYYNVFSSLHLSLFLSVSFVFCCIPVAPCTSRKHRRYAKSLQYFVAYPINKTYNISIVVNLPVHDFGSSLASPQSSLPSQYLSNGRHFVGTRHANSDTLQHCTIVIAAPNSMHSNDKTFCCCLSIWKVVGALVLYSNVCVWFFSHSFNACLCGVVWCGVCLCWCIFETHMYNSFSGHSAHNAESRKR